MGATIIDGKTLAAATKAEAAEKVKALKAQGIEITATKDGASWKRV